MKIPLPKQKAKIKRLKEWQVWLKLFKENKRNRINYIPKAALLLNDLYWRLAEQYLRPVLQLPENDKEEHNIHQYKIISASEITVMMVLPIEDTAGKSKQLNAMLAWFIATSIIEGWVTGEVTSISGKTIDIIANYTEKIDTSTNYPETFALEHVKWLSNLNVTVEKPLLLNAQCWRLFYIACLATSKKGELVIKR